MQCHLNTLARTTATSSLASMKIARTGVTCQSTKLVQRATQNVSEEKYRIWMQLQKTLTGKKTVLLLE